MPIEVATYVSQLVSSNPVGVSDIVGQGDDHFRLLKAVIQNTFPNANKMFRFPITVAPVVGNYTVVFPDDMNKTVPVSAEAASRTVSLPAPSGVHADGFRVTIIKADNSDFTVTISGGTINGFTSLPLFQRYQRVELIWSDAAGVWYAERSPGVPIGALQPWGGGVTTPVGEWLLADNKTIGNGASGATALAHDLARGLFYHLWNAYDNTICPVSAGRGGSAAGDFNGSKTIQLLDMRGRGWQGIDNLGGSDAGLLDYANTPGLAVGAQKVTLVQANLPNINLTATSAGDHAHSNQGFVGTSTNVANIPTGATSVPVGPVLNPDTSTAGAHTHNVPLGGTNTPFDKVPPARQGGWIIKL